MRNTVRLDLGAGVGIWITSERARKLLKSRRATVVARDPLSIRLRPSLVQRWSSTSAGFAMNGGVLERKPPLRLI